MNHAGVYLHIPFCRSRCSYCDFATGMYESELAERYVNSMIEEITKWSEVDNPAVVNTIYFVATAAQVPLLNWKRSAIFVGSESIAPVLGPRHSTTVS